MPQQSHSSGSAHSKKKKAGHKPAHQNTFAYRHNPNSKRTQQILNSPNTGLCRRCHSKIEWRKQYRKYKPLTQPAICNLCSRRNITAAYHTICDDCAKSPAAYDKMIASSLETTLTLEPPVTTTADTVCDSTSALLHRATTTTLQLVCAMCVKEPALADSTKSHNQDILHTEIQSQVLLKEETLGRALKLREAKAVERKVIQAFREEKERLRAERRRGPTDEEDDDEEEEDEEEDEDGGHEEDEGSSSSDYEEDDGAASEDDEELGEENDEARLEDKNSDIDPYNNTIDGDEDDPFLKAVGGADKLLVGEAYREMILEKERQRKNVG